MKRFFGILIQSLVVGSLLGCSPPATEASTPTVMPTPCIGRTITLGDISDDPDEVIRNTQLLANYLAKQLAPFGIVCGRVVVPDTVDKMIAAIESGEVDIYFDSIYPGTLVNDATGAQPILIRWRNCDPEYYTVILTTKNSGINTVEDLPGHMIAMDRPDSTSGFVLPSIYLLDHGLNLVVKAAYDEPVAEHEVGIHFTYDDTNTRTLLSAGKVSAGATDDFNYDEWEKEEPGKFVLLATTDPALRQVVLVRTSLASDLQAAIKDELLKAHLDPDGIVAMQEAARTCKFVDNPRAIEAAFAQMHEMHTRIREIPGWSEAFKEGKP